MEDGVEVIAYDSLDTLFNTVYLDLDDKATTVDAFIERFGKGVSPLAASTFIDQVWGTGSRGKAIKVKLNAFNRHNGQLILSNELSRSEVSTVYQEDFVREYFHQFHTLIEVRVDEILELIKGSSFTEEKQSFYNEVRKNILTYIDFSSPYCYNAELLKQETGRIAKWEDISFESVRAQNGDYLFFDSFKEELRKAHSDFIKVRIEMEDTNGSFWSFYNLVNHIRRVRADTALPYAFADYLKRLTETIKAA